MKERPWWFKKKQKKKTSSFSIGGLLAWWGHWTGANVLNLDSLHFEG